jgi:hypothetical protein
MNPYLLAFAIGLFVLDLTCHIAFEISAPNPAGSACPVAAGARR